MVDNIFTNLFGPIHKYLGSLGLLYHVNGMLILCVVLSITFIYPLTYIRIDKHRLLLALIVHNIEAPTKYG